MSTRRRLPALGSERGRRLGRRQRIARRAWKRPRWQSKCCSILSPWRQQSSSAALRGLIEAVESGRFREASPIGFYFAKLWYYEKLYPLIFTVAALGRASRIEGQIAN